MDFLADLHIHSRFSRATSRQLNPHTLAAWATIKGLRVLGTGDFTHPGWRQELRGALTRDETSGLYRLKDDVDATLALPGISRTADAPAPLFLLQAEISSIYKRHGKVRKVHNLVYMPDMDSAERLSRRLESVGNLAADGRPILGLDSRNLLEMVLEADPRGVVIPAHAWTPWFAVFGSKSGFDGMDACFGDLTPHIFALETGLSSDPAMNRLWSRLDRYTLISNSDAHSGPNLGREANLFVGEPSYDGIFTALRREDGPCAYAGTVEFFPEEGKYHLDGHRACGVVLEPREAMALHNVCPVCGKPLTIGVLHRVLELADRREPPRIAEEPGFTSLTPLPELLGELLGTGAQSRKVAEQYARLVETFGPELDILRRVPEDALRRRWEGLGEGIARMRRGQVILQGGYDGEYGTVRVFTPEEAADLRGGKSRTVLPGVTGTARIGKKNARAATGHNPLTQPETRVQDHAAPPADGASPAPNADKDSAPPHPEDRSAEQGRALAAGPGPVLVMAGPGTGKTHTLMGRIAHLRAGGVEARHMRVITFTRRAAEELRRRLEALCGPGELPPCDTLHAMAWAHLRAMTAPPPALLPEETAFRLFQQSNAALAAPEARAAWTALARARERMDIPDEALRRALDNYAAAKAARRAADYTDLLELWLKSFSPGEAGGGAPHDQHIQHVLVDEAQDLSPLQWATIFSLASADGQGFFGIGDPDQAIYGFRGAQPQVREFLARRWPDLETYSLTDSWRSASGILTCAAQTLGAHSQCGPLRARRNLTARLRLFEAPGAEAEARWVAERVETLLGGASHTMADAAGIEEVLAPGDIAVLVRVRAQMRLLRQAMEQRGIPCALPEQEGCWHEPRVALVLDMAARFLTGLEPSAEDRLVAPPALWNAGLPALRRRLDGAEGFDALFWASSAWKDVEKLWAEEGAWSGLLARVALSRDEEMARRRAERVQVMTLHAAKGLEFRAVFLPGLEEGLLPLDKTMREEQPSAPFAASPDAAVGLDEERRLLYVGITRASEMLFCSYALRRSRHGKNLQTRPSRFVDALRPHCRFTALQGRAHKVARQISLLED